MIIKIALLVIAYLLGSIPFGYLIGKSKGVDIREHGSKNIGATNTGRVLGFRYAVLTYFLDLFKGFIIVGLFTLNIISDEYCLISPMLYGIAAVLGHTFPIFLKFKGGKAVATSGGVILAFSPIIFFSALVLFIIITLIFRYVSLGSIIGTIYILIASLVETYLRGGFSNSDQLINVYFPIGCFILALIIIIRHRANIIRLIKKEESKIKFAKNSKK